LNQDDPQQFAEQYEFDSRIKAYKTNISQIWLANVSKIQLNESLNPSVTSEADF